MRNLKEELDEVRNRICTLDADFIEELKSNSTRAEAGRKRRMEDGKAWEELLKNSDMDLAKFLKQDKADAKRAEATLKELESHLRIIPKEVLLRTQDHINIDEMLSAELAYDNGNSERKWFTYPLPSDRSGQVTKGNTGGVVEGDCGVNSIFAPAEMHPRSYAAGSGTGWNDSNSVHTSCWLWYYISGSIIKKPGTLTVWPYFDIHGYYWVRANDGLFTSKEAEIRLTMSTRLHKYDYTADQWGSWVIRDRGKGNIDEDGRVDFTGYGNAAKATVHVRPGDPVLVQVIAELYSNTRGSGSHALLDFQTGDGNAIRIPKITVLVP